MKKIILFACAACWAWSSWICVFPASAATINDRGRGYSGYYFNDPMGYREVFTEEVVFHLHHNLPSCAADPRPRPCDDGEFYVTVTPTADIPHAYGVSIDDPTITDSELYNGQEGGPSFIFFHDGGAALDPPGNGGGIQFRGSATTSAWAILNSQYPSYATTTFHLAAGTSYDIVGWWYSGKPANLEDGDTITVGIWEPDPVAIPFFATSSLGQYEADGVTAIPERGLAPADTIAFGAVLESAGTHKLQLQVEMAPTGAPFTGVPTVTSTFVVSGNRATVLINGIAQGGYHWQARGADEDGNASRWYSLGDPPADADFVVGSAAAAVYRFTDRSSGIGTDNGQAGAAYGPETVRIKLGRPLGGTGTTTLSLTLDQLATTECGTPGYTIQGYSDGDYKNRDGEGIVFGSWVDASGTTVTSRNYAGLITGTAMGRINPFDYYTLWFNACDASRSVTIAAAPGAAYSCTWLGGGFNNFCYDADVTGEPFMKLNAAEPREPVVIVPGIAGSVLARASDGEEVWPNIMKMVSPSNILLGDAYLDDLALDDRGHSTIAINVPDILRTATATFSIFTVQKDFYGALIDEFAARGYVEGTDLFVAPYDWRFSMSDGADALDAKIQQAKAASPTGKINIVAHSMGGVLVKRYLADYPDHSFLDKLVLVGVPQLGTTKAYKVLNYGDNLGLGLGPVDVLSSAEIKKIAQNMPSLYELLPSERYMQVDGGYVRDFRNGGNGAVLDYGATDGVMRSDPSDGRNPALLDAARAFHADLDGEPVSAPDVYNIVGCRTPTISEFDLYDGGVVDVMRTTGDGTVPEVSAMDLADGFHNYFVDGDATGIDHGGLVADPRSVSFIADIMENGTAADPPPGISSMLEDCVAGWRHGSDDAGMPQEDNLRMTFEFGVHGAVNLEFSDPTGLHAKIFYDDSTDVSIPGVIYDIIGDNTLVMLPATSTYAVKVTPRAASTTAIVEVKERRGSEILKSAAYASVPLSDASATAELAFAGFDGDLAFHIDSDGDGNVDATVLPEAVLETPSSTMDITPPDVTMPAIPAEIAENSTATLAFGASDAESGIASVSAMLNGEPVASGDVITFTEPGDNAFVVIALDNAGNPRIREIDFQVIASSGSDGVMDVGGDEDEGAADDSGASGGGGGGGTGYFVQAAPLPASTSVVASSGDAVLSLQDLLARLRILAAKLFGVANNGAPLAVGARGVDVWACQVFLIAGGRGPATGALAAVGPTGYFGELTMNAVAEYQEQENIAPASGYLGSATRAAIIKEAENDIL